MSKHAHTIRAAQVEHLINSSVRTRKAGLVNATGRYITNATDILNNYKVANADKLRERLLEVAPDAAVKDQNELPNEDVTEVGPDDSDGSDDLVVVGDDE